MLVIGKEEQKRQDRDRLVLEGKEKALERKRVISYYI